MVTARILENDVPVLVITFSAQEVIVFRNILTNEIVQGREDHIDQVTYACVLTKEESRIGDSVTNGWKLLGKFDGVNVGCWMKG